MKNKLRKFMSLLLALIISLSPSAAVFAVSVDEFIGNGSTVNSIVPGFDDGGGGGTPTLANFKTKYPNNSYFSTTGKACTCHGSGCFNYSGCTCIKYEGSIQCDGFAKYVYDYFHLTRFSKYDNKLVYLNEKLNASEAKSKFLNTPMGTYIRVKTSNGSDHSIAIVGTTNETVSIAHANYHGDCSVIYKDYTWKGFVDAFPYFANYLK
ncbi:MAG TPA: hypothetical protein DDX91_08035 [Ruminococcaceae bacterium]|nr:hypothetical protein [Oscillospiraceae bacterium]